MSEGGRRKAARWWAAIGANSETILAESYDPIALEGMAARHSFETWQHSKRDLELAMRPAIEASVWEDLPMSACLLLVRNQLGRIIPSGLRWCLEMDSDIGMIVRWWLVTQSRSDAPLGSRSDSDYQLLVSMLQDHDWNQELNSVPVPAVVAAPVVLVEDEFERVRREIRERRLLREAAGRLSKS